MTKEENKELHTISGKVKQTKPTEEKKKIKKRNNLIKKRRQSNCLFFIYLFYNTLEVQIKRYTGIFIPHHHQFVEGCHLLYGYFHMQSFLSQLLLQLILS